MQYSQKQKLRKASIWVGSIALVILSIYIALGILFEVFNGDLLKKPISKIASSATGRTVSIDGDVRVHLLSLTPGIRIEGLKISNADWAKKDDADDHDMATIGHIGANVELFPLFAGDIIIPALDIADGDLLLLRQADGKANWVFDKKATTDNKPSKLPVIRDLKITNTKLHYIDLKQKLDFSGVINSNQNESNSNGTPFQLTGDGALNNHKFTLHVSGSSLTDIKPGNPYNFNLDVRLGETHIVANGSIDKPFDLGSFKTSLSLEGDDLANLYYLTGLALPNTPPYKITGSLVRHGNEFNFNDFTGKIGDSDIKGQIAVIQQKDNRPLLKADLTSDLLDFKDLGSLIGAAPRGSAVKPLSPEQKQKLAQEQASARLLPDAPLQVDRVRNMDAEVKYRAKAVNAPNLPLKQVAVDVDLKKGILKLSPLSIILPQGTLTGNVTINASKDVPATDIDVRLGDAQLEQFFKAAKAEPALTGKLLARVKVHGIGNSVRKTAATADGDITVVIPHGEIRQAFAELLGINVAKGMGLFLSGDQTKTELRCGVMNFKAQNGLMSARTFVLDTGVVVSTGKGTIDLANESLNLSIKGESKEPSLTLRAPIEIGGTLKKPSIGLGPEAAAQTGIAAALGVVLTPLAAVLPFIDAGLADDADCGALLRSAKDNGAPLKSTASQAIKPKSK